MTPPTAVFSKSTPNRSHRNPPVSSSCSPTLTVSNRYAAAEFATPFVLAPERVIGPGYGSFGLGAYRSAVGAAGPVLAKFSDVSRAISSPALTAWASPGDV